MFASIKRCNSCNASVADNFRILFDDLAGKTSDPKKLKVFLEEALNNGAEIHPLLTRLEQMIPELWVHSLKNAALKR